MIWFLLRDCRSCPAEEAQPAGLMRRCAGTTLRLHDTDTEAFAPSADALTSARGGQVSLSLGLLPSKGIGQYRVAEEPFGHEHGPGDFHATWNHSMPNGSERCERRPMLHQCRADCR